MTDEPCLSRWGSELPEWVCTTAGRDASPGAMLWIAAWVVVLLAIVWFGGKARQNNRNRARAEGKLPPLHRDRNLGRPLTWRELWDDLDG